MQHNSYKIVADVVTGHEKPPPCANRRGQNVGRLRNDYFYLFGGAAAFCGDNCRTLALGGYAARRGNSNDRAVAAFPCYRAAVGYGGAERKRAALCKVYVDVGYLGFFYCCAGVGGGKGELAVAVRTAAISPKSYVVSTRSHRIGY